VPPSAPQARKLENDLDIKIAAYGKLCSSYDYGYAKGETGMATDQVRAGRRAAPARAPPQPGTASPRAAALVFLLLPQMLQSKSSEIDALLARLSDVNASMSSALTGGGDARGHTLARHRDILHDFSQEYRRLAATAGAARDRADLLGGGGGGGLPLLGGAGAGLLLRERGALDRSNAAMDEVMGTAQGVASNLAAQRTLFDSIEGRVSAVAARFPVVNSLLNAVRRRKNRDGLILGGVVAACLLFILLYWANKP
jgi:Golgi SNAP receptor complex protein 1